MTNFLSLQNITVSLGKLNVLVGPNGGGKSNFLSVFRFLGEVARTDLVPALRLFGGYGSTICRASTTNKKAGIKISLQGEVTSYSSATAPDKYSIEFRETRLMGRADRTFIRRREELLLKRSAGRGRRITLAGTRFEYETLKALSRTNVRLRPAGKARAERREGEIGADTSALSVLRRIGLGSDTKQVNELAEVFEDLRLFDPAVSSARRPSLRSGDERLLPSAANLASVLSALQQNAPDILAAIEDDVRIVLPGFIGFEFQIAEDGESIRIRLNEVGIEGSTPISAASFGTVRAIALFTMLRDPNPPRLTLLEEVDHGLHPHALDVLVDRLRSASDSSQIIVATHSPALVNRLLPEELVVFERDQETGVTRIPVIDPQTVLEMSRDSDFALGELWYSGLLGGTPS